MSDTFLDAYSALEARMKIVDVITNNLANANTVGFKRDFGQILRSETESDVATQIDISPGDLMQTGNPLDVAINGSGFFVIDTPEGQRYTRAGNFGLNAAGELVTKDSMKVLSTQGAPVTIGEGVVEVQDNGAVMVDGSEAATLKIVRFAEPHLLQKEGFYRVSWKGPASGIETISDPQVKGGYLERSNVNAINEMVHLMAAYREFEAVQRSLRTLMTDMNTKLIQELGRLV
jgi:flagellar basal-body rod protein FlgF